MDHQSPFWPIFLAFTSAHLDSRLLVPSDWASFIPLVLLIRPRHVSAVLSHSSFYPTYNGQSSEAIVREVNLSRDYAKARRELFDLMERPGLLALVHVQNKNQNPPNPGSLRACVE